MSEDTAVVDIEYPSTEGMPTGIERPREYTVDDDEPRRRLKAAIDSPVLQAIIDSVPRALIDALPKRQRYAIITELESATTITRLLSVVRQASDMLSGREFHKRLARMENNRWDRGWLCPKCSHRWGRHDSDTLECPRIGLTNQEV